MAERPATRGFWWGVLVGLLLAAVAALGLAWFYPPLQAPQVSPESLAAPGRPEGPPEPGAPPETGLMPSAPPGPIVDVPSPDAPPDERDVPPPTPGSPSLVPGGG